jgi:predicted RNase H-like HicB family nuclease
MRSFSDSVEWDPGTKLSVGTVPGNPGAYSQEASLNEAQGNLGKVLEFCLEEYKSLFDDLPHFVGLEQIAVAA